MSWLFSLLTRFLALFLLLAAWIGVLWFGFRFDISRFNVLSLIGMHALPPIAVWGSWLIWRRRAQQAKLSAAEETQKQAEAAQQAQQDAARKNFEETLRTRQYAVDCRWAEVRSNQAELMGAEEVVPISADASSTAEERLLASLTNTLSDLFGQCPGAQRLPIYVAESALFDRELAARAVAACCDEKQQPQVRILPAVDGVAEAVFSRFESDPLAPGALFLTMDGPSAIDDDDEDELGSMEPKHVDALVVLLFTHPDFDLAFNELEAAPGHDGDGVDPMTPYWERNRRQLQGLTERLARMPLELRSSIFELPILGQLRRPVAVAGKKAETAWRSAIEQALINANLKKLVFSVEPTEKTDAEEAEAEDEIPCAWIVHNAGSYETSGERLAALGRGLDAHGIELNIIRQATNVLAQVKLGAVDQWASVALALSRAQALEAPTIWAAFGARSAVGLVTHKA